MFIVMNSNLFLTDLKRGHYDYLQRLYGTRNIDKVNANLVTAFALTTLHNLKMLRFPSNETVNST